MRARNAAVLATLLGGSLLAGYAFPRHEATESPSEGMREAALEGARSAHLGLQQPRASTAGTPVSTAPVVRWASARGESKPFAQLAPGVPSFKDSGELEEHEIGARPPHARAPGLRDSALQASMPAAAAPAPLATFEGISQPEACAGCIPPDTTGAVGKTQYVQMVNEHIGVYNKATGLLEGSIRGINTLFAALPATAVCHNSNDGDPVVIYDQLADRWMVSQFAVPGGNDGYHECIAVSKTGDATGEYWLYDFLVGDANHFHDYPHLGLWPDAYYMSTHVFDSSRLGAGAFAFEREKMLQGQPARMIYFAMYAADPGFWGHLPATLDGANPPPVGAPGLFVEVDADGDVDAGDAMRIWRFHADWNNPSASTFGLNSQPNFKLPVDPFYRPLCGFFPQTLVGCVPQPTSWVQLDSIGDRLMFRAAYRNFGDHESLVMNHTVDPDGNAHQNAPRWYEVRNLSTTPTVYQQGTFAPTDPTDLLYRWMGSIAMDHMGNIGLGYSTSSNISFPSIAYAGRLAGDPLNQFTQGETQMFAGGGSQNPYGFVGVSTAVVRTGRWGDYSTMTVDPADDCTFWFTTEYFPSPVDDPIGHVFTEWHTRIGSFKYPDCVNSGGSGNLAPIATLAATPTSGSAPLNVAFTIAASDPDAGDTVSVDLDFGDGSPHVTSGTAASHSYGAGTWTATLTATDNHGSSTFRTVAINAAGAAGSDPWCSLPGVKVVQDAAGDQLDAGVPGHDALAAYVAEPYSATGFVTPGENKLVFSMDVDSLNPQTPNTTYYLTFQLSDGLTHFVSYATTPGPDLPGPFAGFFAPQFSFGHYQPATGGGYNIISDGATDAESMVDTANHRITWVLTKSKMPELASSPTISGLTASVSVNFGVFGAGDNESVDDGAGSGYQQAGNSSCNVVPPVNHAPVAALASDKVSGDAPLSVQFTVSATDVDGDTLAFDLDFGDGSAHSTSSGAVTHGYSAAGDYTATLTVSDGKGGSDFKTVAIHATQPAPVNHAPAATLSPATQSVHAGEAASFDVGASDVDGDALTVDLDFGDDTTPHGSATGTVGHTYAAQGHYTVTLKVSDGRGGSDTKSATVDVQPAAATTFVAHLSSDRSGGDVTDGPVTVTFTASVENDDGTPIQYTFAFGDGETSTITQSSATISHAYAYAGTYHPYVTAVQDYGSRSAASSPDEDIISTTTHVAVSGTLAAHLAYSLPNGNIAPVDVAFDTSGSDGGSWSIDFGDGTVVNGTGHPAASLTHRYIAPGTYAATLTETAGGQAASQSQTFTIVARQQLTAQLQLSASSGTSPLTLTLDGCHSIAANDGTHIVSFTVDYGDGSAPETKTVDATHVVDCGATDRSSDPSLFSHTYTTGESKTYFPTLTVTDNASAPRTMKARDAKGVSVSPPAAVPAAEGGHHGGAFGWLTLLPLLGTGLWRRRPHRKV